MWKKLKKLKHKQKEQNRIPAPESCFTAKSQHNATLLSCTLTRICHHRNCTSTFCTKQTLMNQSRVKISLQSFLKTNWLCQEFNALYLSTCKVKNRITPLRIKLDEHAFNLHKFGSHTISNIRIQQKDWSSLFVQSPRFVGSRHFMLTSLMYMWLCPSNVILDWVNSNMSWKDRKMRNHRTHYIYSLHKYRKHGKSAQTSKFYEKTGIQCSSRVSVM